MTQLWLGQHPAQVLLGLPGSSLISPFAYEFSRKLPEPVIESLVPGDGDGCCGLWLDSAQVKARAIVMMTAASLSFLNSYLGKVGCLSSLDSWDPCPPNSFFLPGHFPSQLLRREGSQRPVSRGW